MSPIATTRQEDGSSMAATESSVSTSISLGEGCTPEGSTTVVEEAADQLSVDQVSRIMREQDADLLESMHCASSQQSQYSPGGTPILRPKDRSLPIEDVPWLLMPAASTSELLLSYHPENNSNNSNSNGKGKASSSQQVVRTANFDKAPSNNNSGGTVTTSMDSIMSSSSSHKTTSDIPTTENEEQSRFRRLLSGEIRSVDLEGGGVEEHLISEEEETIASPVSVAHEVATTMHKNDQDSGLAERRRMNEAIQFAEAVGEKIGISRDELCIIEDHTDGGECSDSDDDEACESKEIRVATPLDASASMHPETAIHSSQHNERKLEKEQPTALPSHVDVRKITDLTRRKSKRPNWPFGPAGSELSFLDNLSDGCDKTNFAYKGICANPPEITKRGIQRGNYAQIHRKAWLEVSDKYHRYGKNLRSYYRSWEKLGFPTNQFFEWLDSKGEAAGQPLPNLDECPRSVLDSDTVLYITNPEVTDGYSLDIKCSEDGRGRVIDVDGDSVITGPEGWILVLRDNVMYGAEKITSISGHSKQRFHHSSFFGGKAVASAGIIITDKEGFLVRLYPHSGHYRPGESHMQRMLFFLHRKGVNLRTFEMDTQQFRHVSREKDAKGNKEKTHEKRKKDKGEGEKKVKKVDSLHLEKAANVACFLAHKAGFIGEGIFDKIHHIRKADVASVSEALSTVDDGGFWGKQKQPEEENEE